MSVFRKAVTRKTISGATIVDGYRVAGTPTSSTIQASVQPLTPHEVEQLPEGRRNQKNFWLFTDTELNMKTAENPDLVTIDGEDFEVMKVHPWQNGVISHFKILVMKKLET